VIAEISTRQANIRKMWIPTSLPVMDFKKFMWRYLPKTIKKQEQKQKPDQFADCHWSARCFVPA
jgi:hypothetical protein